VTAIDTLGAAREALAEEWERKHPTTSEGIAAFYRESEMLGGDLDAWHALPERQAWTDVLVAAAHTYDIDSVLDVGAGAGHDLEAIGAGDAFLRRVAVEPNDALRHELIEANIEAYGNLANVPPQLFHMVVCIDVLEHVPDPDALLMQIIERVPHGGILAEATATHDHGTPLHLPELDGWHPDVELQRHGFVAREQVDRLTIWERVAEVGVEPPTLLLCAYRAISPETMQSIFDVVNGGWPYIVFDSDALITRVRSRVVSHWYRNNLSDVFLMVDDDIIFRYEDAERVTQLARETKSIACAAYSVRDGSHLSGRALEIGVAKPFGPDLPPREYRYAGTGFMAVHRDVVEAMIATMPECANSDLEPFWPLFDCAYLHDGQLVEDPTLIAGESAEYLSEDYAFCERARRLGYKVWLDPSSILGHISKTVYSVFNMKGVEIREREA
jgi:SAM-dependent methyltransferase